MEAYDINKETILVYIAPKKIESRAHYGQSPHGAGHRFTAF